MMNRAAVAAVVFLITCASAASASAEKQTWEDRVMGVSMSSDDCAKRVQGWVPIAQDAERKGERAWASVIYMVAASCSTNTPAVALAYMEKSVKLGYSICSILASDQNFAKFVSTGKAAKLWSRVTVSPADHHESMWLLSEALKVNHDTTMMITENMNRKDSSQTLVPQSRLPTRSTSNPFIKIERKIVAWLQLYQRYMVMQSDQQRIKHLVNMGIINNMGGSGSGISTRQIQLSMQIANQAAQRRQAAVNARVFQSKGGNTPRPCSAY